MSEYDPILDFWFQDAGEADGRANRRWFGGCRSVDAEIRSRFAESVAVAVDGGYRPWAASARGRLALIILLDQFTRNLYRGTAAAFDGDARAAALCRTGLEAGMDTHLGIFERAFFLMPLEHSESGADQAASVRGFEALAVDVPADCAQAARNFLAHARNHRAIVDRFGRFPHRNTALGRESTDAERAYLADAPRYGQ